MEPHPALQLVFEGVLFAESLLGLFLHFGLTLVDLCDGRHETRAASALAFVTIGVTVMLMGADEVGGIGKSHHHLKSRI